MGKKVRLGGGGARGAPVPGKLEFFRRCCSCCFDSADDSGGKEESKVPLLADEEQLSPEEQRERSAAAAEARMKNSRNRGVQNEQSVERSELRVSRTIELP